MLRLRTLGGLSIEQTGGAAQSIALSAGRRRLALLAVLAASGSRPVPRDKLLAMFWPESDTARARHALDQALYALKRDLRCETFVTGRDELSLNCAHITSDIGDFRAAIARGDHASAAELYGGPFLDGVFVADAPDFEQWAEGERADVERELDDALETLACDAVERDDHRDAARWWQLLAARNPGRTGVIVALMSTLAETGDRRGALRHAELYHVHVRQGDFEPNPAVALLAEQLKKTPRRVGAA
jgi:DNA-binding SARP family transcriptional activator